MPSLIFFASVELLSFYCLDLYLALFVLGLVVEPLRLTLVSLLSQICEFVLFAVELLRSRSLISNSKIFVEPLTFYIFNGQKLPET